MLCSRSEPGLRGSSRNLGAALMPRVQWPLRHGRPCLELVLTLATTAQPLQRTLLADTGAGSRAAGIALLLKEDDCLACGGVVYPPVKLGGAFPGWFPLYVLAVELPALGFS